jgi:hypothetical protein
MKAADQDQRVEELQLALSRAFESRKAPAVSLLDEGHELVMHVTWVTETGRDTTLDSRCSASIRFAAEQIDRYVAMETVQRRFVQDRMVERLQSDVAQLHEDRPDANDCSIEMRAHESWFDVPDDPLS